MDPYHYFRSGKRPDLKAFAAHNSGAALPPEDGPWEFVRTIDPTVTGWPGAVDRSAAEAGVHANGYFLFEHEGEPDFGADAPRATDFR